MIGFELKQSRKKIGYFYYKKWQNKNTTPSGNDELQVYSQAGKNAKNLQNDISDLYINHSPVMRKRKLLSNVLHMTIQEIRQNPKNHQNQKFSNMGNLLWKVSLQMVHGIRFLDGASTNEWIPLQERFFLMDDHMLMGPTISSNSWLLSMPSPIAKNILSIFPSIPIVRPPYPGSRQKMPALNNQERQKIFNFSLSWIRRCFGSKKINSKTPSSSGKQKSGEKSKQISGENRRISGHMLFSFASFLFFFLM